MIALPTPATATWPSDPLVNLPLCTATGDQNSLQMVPDGAGGAIVTWADGRAGGFGHVDIYAQHVTASGEPDPAWPSDGRALCTAADDQGSPAIAADGGGGAIVVWQDNRVGGMDIYAQHVLGNGVVDPAWPVDGRAVNTGYDYQYCPAIVTDGAGGAIVTWQSNDGGAHVFAQHVLAGGTLDPEWPAAGTPLCTDPSGQTAPLIVSDGAGGGIVVWSDLRFGSNPNLFAQRVLANGVVDPAWPDAGRALCTTVGGRWVPRMISDGAGGAIVVWREDYYLNRSYSDIYAQHVTGSGVIDPAWPGVGRATCATPGLRGTPAIVSDGAAGALIAWAENTDIYAQHVQAGGVVDSAWPADGRALCSFESFQDTPAMTTDGAGGAIVAWNDYRHANVSDVYAQHALANGSVDPDWPIDGRPATSAPQDQLGAVLVEDTAGGAILAWADFRAGASDVYAQRVQANGELGGDITSVLLSLVSAEADDRMVRLSWYAPHGGAGVAAVYRRGASTEWRAMGSVAADGHGLIRYEDRAVEPGNRYGYRLGVLDRSGEQRFLGETWITTAASAAFSLEGLRPNPALGDLVVAFSLPTADHAVVELMDSSGRSMARREVSGMVGRHMIDLWSGRAVAPGIYLVRLSQGGRSLTRKACVVR